MDRNDELFFIIATFNTCLGMVNMQKNDAQKDHQEILDEKLDRILSKIDNIERRLGDGKLHNGENRT